MERRRICATELKAEDLRQKSLKVKYEANEVDEWRIFFDGEDVQLITAGYVPAKLLDIEGYPITKNGGYAVFSNKSREDFISWLRDPIKWEKFAISEAVAVGGPSVNQVVKCWNVMNGSALRVSKDDFIFLQEPSGLFNPDSDDCSGYWTVSSSKRNPKLGMVVKSGGYIDNSAFGELDYGVRPLISLPKDIGLQYDEEQRMWLLV